MPPEPTTQGTSAPHIQQTDEDTIFLCITLKEFAPRTRVIILTAAIVVFYLCYFIITEILFRDKSFQFGGFVIFFENFSAAMLAFLELGLRFPTPKAPLLSLAGLGFASILGACTSLYALQRLPFPTWVLFKSCRPISVMIGGVFFLSKRYGVMEYFAVLLMTAGLAYFSLGDYDADPTKTSTFGLLLVSTSLVGNAMHSTFQEKFLRSYKLPSLEIILYPSLFACAMLIPWLLAIGELQAGISYMYEHPQALVLSLVNAPLAYMGLNLIVALMRLTNALNVQIVTSLRKAMTIIFSFLLFAKPFSLKYLFGGLAVFAGLALHVYAEDQASHRKELPMHNGAPTTK